jgi:predicted nucleic acid-binding Zn ribbon protein
MQPVPLGEALSQLIALRGYARMQGHSQLVSAWRQVCDEEWANYTRAIKVQRGVLQVAVTGAPLLSQLTNFRRADLVKQLASVAPNLKITDIKFKLDQ